MLHSVCSTCELLSLITARWLRECLILSFVYAEDRHRHRMRQHTVHVMYITQHWLTPSVCGGPEITFVYEFGLIWHWSLLILQLLYATVRDYKRQLLLHFTQYQISYSICCIIPHCVNSALLCLPIRLLFFGVFLYLFVNIIMQKLTDGFRQTWWNKLVCTFIMVCVMSKTSGRENHL